MNDEDDDAPALLAGVMARLAAGDAAAWIELQDRFGTPIKATLQRIARRRNVRLRPDELDELLTDAMVVLHDVAATWSPEGGAKPWVWAEPRLANVVDGYLGQMSRSLDDVAELHVAVPSSIAWWGEEDDVSVVLARLAREGSAAGDQYAIVGNLKVALGRVASPRDVSIVLHVAMQEAQGDPSPANTVADLFGMKSPAVRKVCSRVHQRLRDYAAEVPEQGLADLALVA